MSNEQPIIELKQSPEVLAVLEDMAGLLKPKPIEHDDGTIWVNMWCATIQCDDVSAGTAAMTADAGLNEFRRRFPR